MLAESCVFGKQSQPPGHCGLLELLRANRNNLQEAPLLPKLRGQFAEFLSRSYLKRLSILYLPTSVGLRYEHCVNSLRGFSWKCGINRLASPVGSTIHHVSVLNGRADLPTLPTYLLGQTSVSLLDLPYSVTPSLKH